MAAKRWPWVLLAGVVGIAVIVGIVMLATPSRATVPNVVGSTISVATQRLHSDGFDVSVVRDNSDKPRNTVVGQNPVGGGSVDEGSTVTLNVSDGPRITEVPNVVGLGRRAARRALTDAGFGVKERRVPDDTVAIDRVIAQTPSGNSQAAQGQAVTLDVSSGPSQGVVPDVVGKSEDDARTALEGAGFRVTVVQKEDAKADRGRGARAEPRGRRDCRARHAGDDHGRRAADARSTCPTSSARRRTRPPRSLSGRRPQGGRRRTRPSTRRTPTASCRRSRPMRERLSIAGRR